MRYQGQAMGRFDGVRYLAAKRGVDDRALNARVLQAFGSAVRDAPRRPLRVLELGAGLGSMPVRLWQLGLVRDASYVLLDRDGEALAAAERELQAWGRQLGQVRSEARSVRIRAPAGALDLALENAELFGYLRDCPPASFDVVLAHAVLDLVDLRSLLPLLWRALVPRALALLTLNFDGETILLPELPLDREVVHLYHRSMDLRVIDGRAAGHSQTGRRLLLDLPASGATVLEAGGSDWLVRAIEGRYPEDETYFLECIVHTIESELVRNPELDPAALARWLSARRAQIAAGELVYIARHIDVLARAPG